MSGSGSYDNNKKIQIKLLELNVVSADEKTCRKLAAVCS